MHIPMFAVFDWETKTLAWEDGTPLSFARWVSEFLDHTTEYLLLSWSIFTHLRHNIPNPTEVDWTRAQIVERTTEMD